MNTFDRAAIVSAIVGVLFAVLTVAIAAPLVSRGLPLEAMVPAVLGSTVKGLLSLLLAGVFAVAARAERRRQALIAEVAAREQAVPAANDNLKPPLAA